MLYIDPRPVGSYIAGAVETGQQTFEEHPINVRSRRIPAKITRYRRLIRHLFADRIAEQEPLRWVDVGCGYGEMLEAARSVLPAGSEVIGVEPMTHKAQCAEARGLEVINRFLEEGQFEADVVSNMDVFSHIPDYRQFLATVATNLKPGGVLLIETGNTADLENRADLPNELGLPDHLTFAGEPQLRRYLETIGYAPAMVVRERSDTITQMAKNAAKLLLGRESRVSLPYTSRYRQLIIRAEPIR
ncbi:MAG: class I SAM-dependent methyltransferase [Qipengyuania sp.]|nr:class I SAM-dependent methyltransferase [Qipengyuania sp.]